MRTTRPALALLLAFSLACGGIWNKAQARAWAELSVKLDAVPDGPNRTRVAEILDEGYLRTAENDIGFSELGDFKPVLLDALEDGDLDDQELAELETIAAPWSAPPAGMAADRQAARATLLADKREVEANERKAAVKRERTSFASWEMPEDLRARLTAAGVEVTSCDSDVYDGLRSSDCRGTLGSDYVLVEVEELESSSDAREELADIEFIAARRDGRTILTIQYVSRDQSKALSDAVLAESPLHSLSIKDIKNAGVAQGFRKRTMECGDDTEDGETNIDCNFEKSGAHAYVWLNREAGAKPGGEQFAEFDADAWEVDAPGMELETTVHVTAPAAALMDAMFSAEAVGGPGR